MSHVATNSVVATAVCSFVVALYAAKRYDTPETNRLSTTRSLFQLSRAGYVATSLVLFFVLSEVVLMPGVLPFLGLEDFQKTIAEYSAPPVLAAVLLTTLLPNTAVVSTADAWILKYFQSLGRIPNGVRILADELSPEAQLLNDTDVAKLRDWVVSDGDVPSDLAKSVNADRSETTRGSLTRVLLLYLELQNLEALPLYATPFRTRQETWRAIKADFQVFVIQSQAFFVLFDQLPRLEGTAGENALKKANRCYREICQNTHRRMVEFLAQLLLVVEGTEPRISTRLRSIGFDIPMPPCRVQVGPFLFIGVMMIIAILGVISVAPPTPGQHPLPLAVTAILIGTTRLIGLLAAVLPKLRWSAFRPDSSGNFPYMAWLESAALAGVLSFLIERAALAVAHQALAAAVDFAHYPFSPMAPMAFASSLSIAILCDVDLRMGRGLVRSVTEGMLCGFAMTVCIFICTHVLDIPAATEGQAPSWLPAVLSFFLGFASGFFVPYFYRRACDEEQEHKGLTPAYQAG